MSNFQAKELPVDESANDVGKEKGITPRQGDGSKQGHQEKLQTRKNQQDEEKHLLDRHSK